MARTYMEYKGIRPHSAAPAAYTEGSAGVVLCSSENITIPPNEKAIIKAALSIEYVYSDLHY